MSTKASRERGSGLIIAISVLAMLAIMATSFITLMRLDTRVTRNYVDDQRCEMLAHGMMNYFKALLRDDLDRTWGKYENRDCGVGFISRNYSNRDEPEKHVPGLLGYAWGTPVCNDFWFSSPWLEWGAATGYIYAPTSTSYYGTTQQSFAWNDKYGSANGMIGRYKDPSSGYEFDIYVGLSDNFWGPGGETLARGHPDAGAPIDDDMDGVANPVYVYDDPDWNTEHRSRGDFYYDRPPFVIFSGPTYYQPGSRMTDESALPGDVYWRWGVKLGPTHSAYANLNAAGNLDGTTSYVNRMGGGSLGLMARIADDEAADTVGSQHLGRLEWKGFQDEYEYVNKGGFPRRYDNVMYSPAATNLEKLFHCHEYSGVTYDPGALEPPNVGVDRAKARALIRYRWGADGLPADGQDHWRVGWRRDGATYYKFPSPENPIGDDRYFGANEVMEHDHSVEHPGTSAVAAILGDADWRKVRPHVTMWSTDTILRGKIWPTEGPPYTSQAGNWRHIDVLKRINLNMIGAKGPEGLPGEDVDVKLSWAAKAPAERDRLYYMLLAAMQFSGTANASQEACQFIASLTDMVDRDHDETYYEAPNHTAWALGVEKVPVINEIVFYSRSQASTPNYELFRLRVELYNPVENIPWIPDEDEAYPLNDYWLRIGSHDYRIGDLTRYTDEPNTEYGTAPGLVDSYPNIGAEGMYAYPGDASKKSWGRFMHVGWSKAENWPPGVTKAELEAGLEFSLWKPLKGDANANVPITPGMVETLGAGVKCICVDKTPSLRLVRPYGTGTSYRGPGDPYAAYLGIYRRWDPMNAKIFGTQGSDERSNVLWCPGWSILNCPTLGRPNVDYPANASTQGPPGSGTSSYQYKRLYERNFKVVDGDLPSVGWLGELMMRNCAQHGPLTWVHAGGQDPSMLTTVSRLDTHAKFDLYRPFRPARKYSPTGPEMNPVNLHVLDIFTVWDPSNDGIDNDGDGAVDDDDTGRQHGDKCGPEIRVFGRLDVNMVSTAVMAMAWPDGKELRSTNVAEKVLRPLYYTTTGGRTGYRTSSYYGGWGPFETIGDFLRADRLGPYPGSMLCGYSWYGDWTSGTQPLSEFGLSLFSQYATVAPGVYVGDDDGDGTYDERDERDMIFTWIANHFTTRANVFEVDINAEICEPPYYPDRKLPYPTYKSRREFARKQLLGILDRSTVLRVNVDGTCDFSGPVEVRMLRMTDDLRVY